MEQVALTTGQQMALGWGINIVAFLALLGPTLGLWWKYCRRGPAPIRVRLGVFAAYVVLFVLLWWGYLYLDTQILKTFYFQYHSYENIAIYADYVSWASIPLAVYFLLAGKQIHRRPYVKIGLISLGVWLSFWVHLWLSFARGIKFFG